MPKVIQDLGDVVGAVDVEFERVGRIEHLETLLAELRTHSCECERMDSSSRATQLGALSSNEAVEVERLVIMQNELVDAVASLRRQLGER